MLLQLALSQLSGILGVGIFALPYLFYHSNLFFSLVGLFLSTLITYKVNTSYIKVITSLKTNNQLSGYAQYLLGAKSKYVVGINMFLLSFGALLVFVQMSGKFLKIIFGIDFGSYLFVFMILILFRSKNNFLNNLFKYLPFLFILIPLLLFFYSLNNSVPLIFYQEPNLDFLGWTMFAISGFTILPELWMKAKTCSNPVKLFKLSSLLGLVLAMLIYVIFIFAILNLTGDHVSSDVVTSLQFSHPSLAILVAIFGFFSVTKASLNFLHLIYDLLYLDLKISPSICKITTFFIPAFGLLILNFNYDKPIKLLATISVFTSIAIIFILRLKLGGTPFYKKIIMAICLLLFLGATVSELR